MYWLYAATYGKHMKASCETPITSKAKLTLSQISSKHKAKPYREPTMFHLKETSVSSNSMMSNEIRTKSNREQPRSDFHEAIIGVNSEPSLAMNSRGNGTRMRMQQIHSEENKTRINAVLQLSEKITGSLLKSPYLSNSDITGASQRTSEFERTT